MSFFYQEKNPCLSHVRELSEFFSNTMHKIIIHRLRN